MRSLYKKISRLLLLLLVFAAIVPFVYPMKNGKPLLSLDQFKLPSLPEMSLPDISLSSQEKTAETGTVTAYKWQDGQGNWFFGSEPPQGIRYELMELDPNANLIQGLKAAPEPVTQAEASTTEMAAQPGNGEVVFGYTPEKIEAMMEKTRQVKDAMDAHHTALEGLDK